MKCSIVKILTEEDMWEHVITKRDFIKILNTRYHKVNNFIEFSPSQINMSFSLMVYSKQNNGVNQKDFSKLGCYHDSKIDNYIQKEYQEEKIF